MQRQAAEGRRRDRRQRRGRSRADGSALSRGQAAAVWMLCEDSQEAASPGTPFGRVGDRYPHMHLIINSLRVFFSCCKNADSPRVQHFTEICHFQHNSIF